MKNLQIISILSMLLMFPFALNAQKLAGDYEVGLGVAYGFDIPTDGEIGMNANLYYSITDEIRLGADFTYYLVDDEVYFDPTFYELNLNTHYHVINEEVFRLYALLGLHYAYLSYEDEMLDNSEVITDSIDDSDVGLNLGGGVELNFDSIILFGEPRMSIGGFEQLSVTAGGRLFF